MYMITKTYPLNELRSIRDKEITVLDKATITNNIKRKKPEIIQNNEFENKPNALPAVCAIPKKGNKTNNMEIDSILFIS